MLWRSLAGAALSALSIYVDVWGHRSSQAPGVCTATVKGDVVGAHPTNDLPALFALAVTAHSVCAIAFLAVACAAVLDANVRMKAAVAGKPPQSELDTALLAWAIPATVILTGVAFAFWLMLLLADDVHACLRLPVVWWYLFAQLVGTLALLGFAVLIVAGIVGGGCYMIFLVGGAAVENLRLWRRYRELVVEDGCELGHCGDSGKEPTA